MKKEIEIYNKLQEKKELRERKIRENNLDAVKTLECQIKIYEWVLQ